ncbi:MAG: hypothetical protein A2992_01590 [Elusimicrobia bacterium RIFCSPLOWO2_01_FULL_59_12]|nr:MAG: hypothetical protein A2992_01590 [Elusimicrobia bacterium RIFCSPLOWO2_01_FULL_59_12]
MSLTFEWDHRKAKQNVKKHGVSFEEASTVFSDVQSITIHDPLHSDAEDRFVDMGLSAKLRVLIVAYTERGDRIRIIHARVAAPTERKTYEEKHT